MQKSKSQNPDCTKRKLKLQSKEHDLQRKASGEKALSWYCIILYCIVVIRRKEANVTKKDGKQG